MSDVWVVIVFGINSASNVGRKIVIVQGTAEHYYNFTACIMSAINSKYYTVTRGALATKRNIRSVGNIAVLLSN